MSLLTYYADQWHIGMCLRFQDGLPLGSTSWVHSSLRIGIGPFTVLPHRSSKGAKPVLSCGASLYANRRYMYRSQSLGFSAHIFFNVCLRVPLNFSTSPLHFGLYGVLVICLIDRSLLISLFTLAVNCVPWSDITSFGNPTLEYIFNNSSATRSASIDLSGTASGYLVAYSQLRLKCTYVFAFEQGIIGPTRSIATLSNGLSIKGVVPKGTFVTRPFCMVRWQISHDWQ